MTRRSQPRRLLKQTCLRSLPPRVSKAAVAISLAESQTRLVLSVARLANHYLVEPQLPPLEALTCSVAVVLSPQTRIRVEAVASSEEQALTHHPSIYSAVAAQATCHHKASSAALLVA